MRKLNVNLDVIASKIKLGYGEHICEILLGLLDATLRKKHVNLSSPIFPRNDDNSKLEKDLGGDEEDSVEFEGNIAEDEDAEEVGLATDMDNDNKKVIESKANDKEWKLEVEKVRRHLETVSTVDQKEWRYHIERSKELSEKIQEDKPKMQNGLEKLADVLDKHLDRIGSREREINKVMAEIGEEYKSKSERFKELNLEIEHLTTKGQSLADEHSQLALKQQQLQAKLDGRTNDTTNNQSLIQIKETIQHLKKEIQEMDVRIGVLNNIVWRHDFETRKQILDETTMGRKNQDKQLYLIAESPDMGELDGEDED